MSFLEFVFSLDNYIFTGAIILILFLVFVETFMKLTNAGVSDMIDEVIPDFDDLSKHKKNSFLINFFRWIRVKQIPFLILLVIFLFSFGVSGLFVQSIIFKSLNTLSLSILVIIPSFLFSLFVLRVVGGVLEMIFFKKKV